MCQPMHNDLERRFHQRKWKAPRFSETVQSGAHRPDCRFPAMAFVSPCAHKRDCGRSSTSRIHKSSVSPFRSYRRPCILFEGAAIHGQISLFPVRSWIPLRIPPVFWNFEKTKISKAEAREAGKKRPMAQFCYQKQTCAIGRCKKLRSKPSCLEKIAASCCSPFCFTIWLAAYLSCQEIESVNCKYIVTGSLPTYFSFIPLLFLNSASTIAIRWRYQESPQIRTPRFVMFVWSSVSPMHDSLGIRISVEEKCSAIFASSGNRLLQRAEKVQRVNAPWTNRDSAPSLYTVSS